MICPRCFIGYMPLKHCRHCKGRHRTRSAFLKCKKRNGPKEYWS